MQAEDRLFESYHFISGNRVVNFVDDAIDYLLNLPTLKKFRFSEQELSRGSVFLDALRKRGIDANPETEQGFLLQFIAKLASIKNKSIEQPEANLFSEIQLLINRTRMDLAPFSEKAANQYFTPGKFKSVDDTGKKPKLFKLENVDLKIFDEIEKKLQDSNIYFRNFSQHLELIKSITLSFYQLAGTYISLKDRNLISGKTVSENSLNKLSNVDFLAFTLKWLETNHPSKDNFKENLAGLKKVCEGNFVLEWIYDFAAYSNPIQYKKITDIIFSLQYDPQSRNLLQNFADYLKTYYETTTDKNQILHYELHEEIIANYIEKQRATQKNSLFWDFLALLNEYAKKKSTLSFSDKSPDNDLQQRSENKIDENIENLFPKERRVFFEKSSASSVKRNITHLINHLQSLNESKFSLEENDSYKNIINTATNLLYSSYFIIDCKELKFEDYENLFKFTKNIYEKIKKGDLIKVLQDFKYKSSSLENERRDALNAIKVIKFNSQLLIDSLKKISFSANDENSKNNFIIVINNLNQKNEKFLSKFNELVNSFDYLITAVRDLETSRFNKKDKLAKAQQLHSNIIAFISSLQPEQNEFLKDVLEDFGIFSGKMAAKKPSEQFADVIATLKKKQQEGESANEKIFDDLERKFDQLIKTAKSYDDPKNSDISEIIVTAINQKNEILQIIDAFLARQKSENLTTLKTILKDFPSLELPTGVKSQHQLAIMLKREILGAIDDLNSDYTPFGQVFIKQIKNDIDGLEKLAKEIEQAATPEIAKNKLAELKALVEVFVKKTQDTRMAFAPFFMNWTLEIPSTLQAIIVDLEKWKLSKQAEAHKNRIIDQIVILNSAEKKQQEYSHLLTPLAFINSPLANYINAANTIIENGEFISEKLADLEKIYNIPDFINQLLNLTINSDMEAEHRMKIYDLAHGQSFKANLNKENKYISLLETPETIKTTVLGQFLENTKEQAEAIMTEFNPI